MVLLVHGMRIDIRPHYTMRQHQLELTREQLRRMEATLTVLPPHHVAALAHIQVRQLNNYSGGSCNRIQGAPRQTSHWVMIDYDAFSSRHNRGENGLMYTLLHEMGHVVDWTFGGFEWTRRNDREGYELLLEREHRGRTMGDFEKFADAYADLHYPGARGARRWPQTPDVILRCEPLWQQSLLRRSPAGAGGPTAMA